MTLFPYMLVIICSVIPSLPCEGIFPPYKILAENGTTFFDEFDKTDRMRLDLVIQHDGYAAENHEFHTEDGFKIMLHRIKLNGKEGSNGEPILMIHGTFVNAATWLYIAPGHNLAYKLSDMGNDVWLMNHRGKPASNGHISLQPQDPEYWNWGSDEIGYYDVPNTIDYVLKVTRKKKLSIIAHSFGCTVSFIALTDRPEYNAKVRVLIPLAPEFTVSYSEVGGLWGQVDKFINLVQSANLQHLANSEVIMGGTAEKFLFKNCSVGYERRGCSSKLAELMGFDVHNPDENWANMYRAYTICNGRLSRKILMHLSQMGTSGNFSKFDYGEQKNLEVYKSKSPPLHDLEKLNVPIHMFYSLGDRTVVPKVIFYCEKLKELKKDVHCYEIKDNEFGHTEFVVSTAAAKYVYETVFDILRNKEQ